MKIPIYHPELKAEATDNKFTKNELKFIQFMEEDADLGSFIESARERANIPTRGFDLNIPLSKYTESGEFQKMDLNKVYDQASLIHDILYGHLPRYWITTLIPLIVFNIALPPERIEIEPIEVQANRNTITIIIRRRVSRGDIKMFLDDKKDALDQQLVALPMRVSMPKIKVKEIELLKKIKKLKSEGKSDLEIANELDMGSDAPSEFDHAAIGVYRNRFDKYRNKYLDLDRRNRIVKEALRIAMERLTVKTTK